MLRGYLGLVCVLLVPSACSRESSSCPVCSGGYVCDPATLSCVPAGGCPTSCGLNASCVAGTCACLQGWNDCDGDRANPGGNGCECDKGCVGQLCQDQPACTPEVIGICGDETRYCDGNGCQGCPPGSFNCDGLGPCESSLPCRCQVQLAGACGGERYHCTAGGICQACAAERFNCDGIGDCECDRPCYGGACPPACDAECRDFDPAQCVKDPSENNRCVDCLDDSHCTVNIRSTGPRCDLQSKLCVCEKNADCAGSTSGLACRQVGEFLQCSCDNNADCPPPYTICEGMVIKHCVKPCTVNEDCTRGPNQGTCNTTTGECEFVEF